MNSNQINHRRENSVDSNQSEDDDGYDRTQILWVALSKPVIKPH